MNLINNKTNMYTIYNVHGININKELEKEIQNLQKFKFSESDLLNYKSTSVSENNIKINDVISVDYIPCSQKYLLEFEKYFRFGKIFFLNNDNTNGLMYYDNNNIRYVSSIEIIYYGYFGDSRGYYMNINKHC